LYTLDGLSTFGKLSEKQSYLTFRQEDANRNIRWHATIAMERDDKHRFGIVPRALCDYNLKGIRTCTRVGLRTWPSWVFNPYMSDRPKKASGRLKAEKVLLQQDGHPGDGVRVT
jgi:hypothetical protein